MKKHRPQGALWRLSMSLDSVARHNSVRARGSVRRERTGSVPAQRGGGGQGEAVCRPVLTT